MKPSVEIRRVVDRWLAAVTTCDVESVLERLSPHPGTLVIGTDPPEWWHGPEAAVVFGRQLEEVGRVTAQWGEIEAWEEGDVGWAAAKYTFTVPSGTHEVRTTYVLHLERGEWKIVQSHWSLPQPDPEMMGKALPYTLEQLEATIRRERPDGQRQPVHGTPRRRVARQVDERAFDVWVERVTERADPVMAWLGVVFALLVGYELAVDVSAGTADVLRWTGWAIWAVFVVEYAAKLWVAPARARFVRRHWLQALVLLVPTLRVLRMLRLMRLGRALPAARVASTSYRSLGTARRLAGSRIAYLAAVTSVVTIAIAQLAYVVEPREGPFERFGDTLLWAAAVVFGQQAEPVPSTAAGRVVMNLGFVLGLTVVAALAGTLGAWFIDARRERSAQEERAPDPAS